MLAGTADVFALQDRITAAFVRELGVALLPDEAKRLAKNDTNIPAAYDVFLIGWGHLQSRTFDAMKKAKSSLERAVKLDPHDSRAWGALAELHLQASYRAYQERLGLDMDDVPALLEKALARPRPQAYDAQLHWLAI